MHLAAITYSLFRSCRTSVLIILAILIQLVIPITKDRLNTFAFPRMIWYLALVCLLLMNYSFKQIGISTLVLYGMYVVIGIFYYLSTIGFLKKFKDIRRYYAKQWYVLPLMPLFNLLVFFIRFAGVVNSIQTDSAWKTKDFTQEKQIFKKTLTKDWLGVMGVIRKIRRYVNNEGEKIEEK